MNHEDKAKEFYRNFFLPSKTTKKPTNLLSPKPTEISKVETPKKGILWKKNHKEDISKQGPKPLPPEKIEEINKKYEQDLQLAYYSDLQHLTNTFYKKGNSAAILSLIQFRFRLEELKDFSCIHFFETRASKRTRICKFLLIFHTENERNCERVPYPQALSY